MLKEPYTLAEGLHPSCRPAERVFSSTVFSVTNSRKRKRSELVLPIDRSSVNIYSVPSGKTVASYVVSPQTTFTCPPCSLWNRPQGGKQPQRRTYCSIKSPRPRLIGYIEEESNSGAREILSVSIDLKTESSRVIYLDIIPAPCNGRRPYEQFLLLVTHEDGQVSFYDSDLVAEVSNVRVCDEPEDQRPSSHAHVEFATLISVKQCEKALLKGRHDILAPLDGQEKSYGSLLLLVTRLITTNPERGQLQVRLLDLKIQKPRPDSIGKLRQPCILLSLDLPEPGSLQPGETAFSFDASSGTLYQCALSSLLLYDLTGSLPHLAHRVNVNRGPISSTIHISPSTVAVSTDTTVSIISLPYCSLQAQMCLEGNNNKQEPPQISKDQHPSSTPAKLQLLSYFAPLDLMVVLLGHKLLAIQLSTSSTASTEANTIRKRKRPGLLADSIGRGSSLFQTSRPHDYISKKPSTIFGSSLLYYEQVSKDLDLLESYFAKGDMENFEAAILSQWAARDGEVSIDPRKVSYILDKMFSITEVEKSRTAQGGDGRAIKLRIKFWPEKVCIRLMNCGLLNVERLEAALRKHDRLTTTNSVSAGSLAEALLDWDTSLVVLKSVLASPVAMSPFELVHALLAVGAHSEWQKADGKVSQITGNVDMLGYVDGDDKRQLSILKRGPATHSSHAQAENIQSQVLQLILKRLYAQPSTLLTQALKTQLAHPQLRVLLDTLRMEVAHDGWLSAYEDSVNISEVELSVNDQISLITHLLNCVIDAIGTGGWVIGSSLGEDLAETANTIAYMKAEVSAALEGIEEATYLKGLLGEVLLCGKKTLESSLVKGKKTSANDIVKSSVEPMTVSIIDETSRALPLGLKLRPVIPLTKVGAGGEISRRSKRDIGRLKSKTVGKYSFERIDV